MLALLCTPVSDGGIAYSQRMVTLLIDGLRYAAELQRSCRFDKRHEDLHQAGQAGEDGLDVRLPYRLGRPRRPALVDRPGIWVAT